jgi:hypothetical protein
MDRPTIIDFDAAFRDRAKQEGGSMAFTCR